MEGEGYDPDGLLWVFALWGLIKGWAEVMQPAHDDRSGLRSAAMVRLYGMVLTAALVIDMRSANLAWASVLHFVLKYLGTYHGCRLLSWSVTAGLARIGVNKPPLGHQFDH